MQSVCVLSTELLENVLPKKLFIRVEHMSGDEIPYIPYETYFKYFVVNNTYRLLEKYSDTIDISGIFSSPYTYTHIALHTAQFILKLTYDL